MTKSPADFAIRTAMRMAEELAIRAEQSAPDFKDVSGDVALRMFAEAIRKTNREMDPDKMGLGIGVQ